MLQPVLERVSKKFYQFRTNDPLPNHLNPEILIATGDAQMDRTYFDLAEKYYKEAIKMDSEHPMAYFKLGVCLEKQGQIEPAIEALTTAVTLRARFPEAHELLAELHARQGKHREARADLTLCATNHFAPDIQRRFADQEKRRLSKNGLRLVKK